MVMIKIRSLNDSPGSIPNAIPGFSTRVMFNRLSINGLLSPGENPLKLILNNGRLMPLTKSLLT